MSTVDKRIETALKHLRADLARVTAERDRLLDALGQLCPAWDRTRQILGAGIEGTDHPARLHPAHRRAASCCYPRRGGAVTRLSDIAPEDVDDERRQAEDDATCEHGAPWWADCTPCEIETEAAYKRMCDR